jgi:hypothetical protein
MQKIKKKKKKKKKKKAPKLRIGPKGEEKKQKKSE